MKFLIFFIAILINSILTTVFSMTLGTPGALLTLILWMVTLYPAYKLCEKWDIKKLINEAQEKGCQPIDLLLENDSEDDKKELKSHRGNEKELVKTLKGMLVKKRYWSFYLEHFMKK